MMQADDFESLFLLLEKEKSALDHENSIKYVHLHGFVVRANRLRRYSFSGLDVSTETAALFDEVSKYLRVIYE